MPSVVFLRGINVGGANLCRPSQIAKQLSKFDVVNIGAVGTFVVRKNIGESVLCKKIAVQLAKAFGVKCEIMIVPANRLSILGAKIRSRVSLQAPTSPVSSASCINP